MSRRRSAQAHNKSRRRAPRKVYPQVEGRVQMTRDGYVFVVVEGEEEDVFVRASKTRGALNGDTVRVAVTKIPHASEPSRRKSGRMVRTERREGEIVEIVRRSEVPFIGIYHKVKDNAWVLMQARNMPYDIEVDASQAEALGAQVGFKVSVIVDHWDRGEMNPVGHIVDVLGAPGENDTEMHAILAEFNLPYRFDKEVEEAAGQIPSQIGAAEMKGRKDFRDVFTFTIDPADAKDFDDALSFRKLSNGNFEVGVHIADVSHYVQPGSVVDKEAQQRGCSVYLVDRTVPMLPETLCNKLCSLRPDEDKLTFSAVFEITPDAKVRKKWFGRTAIRSNHRLSYEQAQGIITGQDDSGFEPTAELKEAVLVLNDLAHALKMKRAKAGAIDFDRPEMKVKCDSQGRPIEIYQKYSVDANWLIEEFMLLANRSVAELIAKTGKTFVYRIHDVPNAEKVEGLRSFAKTFGYKMKEDVEGRKAAIAINDLLKRSAGTSESVAFKDLALRSMAKARYSTDNIGHYGLAFDYYTHFTSPIRRYPDLLVHRLLARYLDKGASEDKGYYDSLCDYASQRENVAADAERTSIKYKLVEYMQSRVGNEYSGHISGLTEWGMYVEIEPTHIEGMVALREIKGDFYEFDEKKYLIRGRRTRKIYRLGDQVRIRVSNANLEQRLLDFELIGADGKKS